MLMKEKRSGDLIRVQNVEQLANPLARSVRGRRQAGEEEQDEREFAKNELSFPSGEQLPQSWTDAHYALKA
jgi:hypothetical protein